MKLKNEKLLDFINTFHKKEQRYPTRREIATALNVSTETIQRHIKTLEKKGQITLKKGKIISLNLETETVYTWEVHSDYKEYGIPYNSIVLFSTYWRALDVDLVLVENERHKDKIIIRRYTDIKTEQELKKMVGVVLGILKKAPKRHRRRMARYINNETIDKVMENGAIKKAGSINHLLFSRQII